MLAMKKISIEEEIREAMKKSKKAFSKETLDRLTVLLGRLDEKCPPQPYLPLKPMRAASTTVFDSKLGGVPYFPKGMEYPSVLEGEFAGKPLKLLAQLNFAELPHLEGFPEKGILQFFAGCDGDDVYGVDFNDYFAQNGFRVIYHENIIEDTGKLMSVEDLPSLGSGGEDLPFTGEFLLRAGETCFRGIAPSDFRFDSAVAESFNELFGGDVAGMWVDCDGKKGIFQVDEALYHAIDEVRSAYGTGIGGFPYFTQQDIRSRDERYRACDTVLFQLDSEFGEGIDSWKDEIMWGDSGVGNFFISAGNLAKRDFSKVLYTWDCC